MSWLRRVRRWFGGSAPRAVFDRALKDNPLREFIYLDEVSLRSLLSSKKGEMTESTLKEVAKSFEKESRDSAVVSVPTIVKADTSSRFQTRNSSSLQTAKKATVQSWFRELDRIKGIKLIETVQQVNAFASSDEIATCDNRSVSIDGAKLRRGEMAEFRVRLSADPIFHLVTLVSEFKGMAEDYPDMMSNNGGFAQLREVEGISKVLQRLLAGLIPVRAEVLDYVIVEIAGTGYLVHVDALDGLEIERKPIEIVCVTELDAYWKDIRRVLFSGAEFTMLCRIAKTGIQDKWTPIKLADLLKGLVPDLPEQLDIASRLLFDPAQRQQTQSDSNAALRTALASYSASFLEAAGTPTTSSQRVEVEELIAALELKDQSATTQKKVFSLVGKHLSRLTNAEMDAETDLSLRESARQIAGLGHLGAVEAIGPAQPEASLEKPRHIAQPKQFLDVEVVAMYW